MNDRANGIDSNFHEFSPLMNPSFVCERWMDASEYGVATGRDNYNILSIQEQHKTVEVLCDMGRYKFK